ncbi:MAG: TauD/TfdA family dioxygenase [Gammaproteobacteria bacterium]|nr:TauD/TfdA family dioxygenase [Gammaproteobacteria bacterium]
MAVAVDLKALGIDRLSVEERLALNEELWESLSGGEAAFFCTRRTCRASTTCAHAIKGLHPEESRAVLDMLKRHGIRDSYCCRFRYRNKSLMLWDNRAVQHSPNSDYTGERLMLRLALHSDWRPGT